MSKRIELEGKIFGRLKVVEYIGDRKYKCKCNCGKTKNINTYSLRSGVTSSCGCYQKERASFANYKHGMKDKNFYNSWSAMKQRCLYKKAICYKNYGGRGIKICKKWLDFMNFKEDMYKSYLDHFKRYGRRNTTLDRIDNNGNYCKESCRWATALQQNNNSRNCTVIRYKGEQHTISEWALILNMCYTTLQVRLYKGWTAKRAIEKPIGRWAE